jgi:hypothetical protein
MMASPGFCEVPCDPCFTSRFLPARSRSSQLYLHQLHETAGADLPPPAVLRVLRSKACRTAIMFGDMLDREQCYALLGQLRGTQLWTQCAHGRPTVAPLVHLPTLRAILNRRRAVTRRAGRTGAGSVGGVGPIATRRLSAARLRAVVGRGIEDRDASGRRQGGIAGGGCGRNRDLFQQVL